MGHSNGGLVAQMLAVGWASRGHGATTPRVFRGVLASAGLGDQGGRPVSGQDRARAPRDYVTFDQFKYGWRTR